MRILDQQNDIVEHSVLILVTFFFFLDKIRIRSNPELR